jgi:hypothetical protein
MTWFGFEPLAWYITSLATAEIQDTQASISVSLLTNEHRFDVILKAQ